MAICLLWIGFQSGTLVTKLQYLLPLDVVYSPSPKKSADAPVALLPRRMPSLSAVRQPIPRGFYISRDLVINFCLINRDLGCKEYQM